MLTRPDLISILEAHANTLRLASVYRILARGSDLAAQFKTIVAAQPSAAFEPSVALLEDRLHLVHCVDQLYLITVRAAVTESFELTKDYCTSTNQQAEFQRQQWYAVFRLIRNCLNHNFRLQFRQVDAKNLPAKWRGVEITQSHEGQALSQAILPPQAAIEWLEELDRFVSNVLQ